MKYLVEFHRMFIKVEVEADSEAEAEKKAMEDVYLTTEKGYTAKVSPQIEDDGEFELAMIEEN